MTRSLFTLTIAALAALLAACSEEVLPGGAASRAADAGAGVVTAPSLPVGDARGAPTTPLAGGTRNPSPMPASSDAGAGAPVPSPTAAACPPVTRNYPATPWVPPNPLHEQVCSLQEAQVVAACFTLGGQYCAALANVSAQCQACGVTSSSSPTYGALVQYDQYHPADPNVAGCVSALTGDVSASSCGAKLTDAADCEAAVCSQCTADQAGACQSQAGQTTCSAQASAASCAQQALATCVQGSTATDVALHLVEIFCM